MIASRPTRPGSDSCRWSRHPGATKTTGLWTLPAPRVLWFALFLTARPEFTATVG